MTLRLAQLLADSTGALGHLTATELALLALELTIDVVALALIGSALRRPRQVLDAAVDLDEAA